jgi:hypothetical protein
MNKLLACLCFALSIGLFSFRSRITINIPPADNPLPEPTPDILSQPISPAPENVKAIYLTAYSAGNQQTVSRVMELASLTEINGVIIDVKDYTGTIAIKTNNGKISSLGSENVKIPDFPELVRSFHRQNIYVIARLVVFKDPHLVKVKPNLAIMNSQTKTPWKDRKGLSWVDPASREVWDYNIAVAEAIIKTGVDEINFDYIRFPSDGDIRAMAYPVYNPQQTAKSEQIRRFFEYLSQRLKNKGVKLSADIFGIATVQKDDQDIGQIIEFALPYFDYICPMIYPSHFANGFLGYKNPADYPYEIVHYSMTEAQNRKLKLQAALINNNIDHEKSTASTTVNIINYINIDGIEKNAALAKFRPWLQVFDIGASYTPEMVKKQIQATYDTGNTSGWYLWNPSNIYSKQIFLSE